MASRQALQKHGGQALQSATKTAGKPARGGWTLDLLTIALKTDFNKTMHKGILQKPEDIELHRNPFA